MQAICDLDIKFTSKSDSHSIRLQNQICNIHAKFKCCQSVQSSLAYQTSAYFENEKNFRLYSQMSMQLSWKSRNIAEIQWINKWHAQDKHKHITEISHFINSLSILQCKSDWEVQSIEN